MIFKKVIMMMVATTCVAFCGCSLVEKTEKSEETEPDWSIYTGSVDETVKNYCGFFILRERENEEPLMIYIENNIYTKDEVCSYELSSSPQGFGDDVVFRKKDEDELQIPTMYADDKLVYIADEGEVLTEFAWKRYRDEGYSVAIRNLQPSTLNSYTFTNEYVDIPEEYKEYFGYVPEEDDKPFSKKNNEEDNPILTYSFISANGVQLSEENVKDGVLSGIEPNENGELECDIFLGTESKKLTLPDNFRTYRNFENYWTHGAIFNTKGYIEITLPKEFYDGYYSVNDGGIFRYVDKPYSEDLDISTIDYNKPRYTKINEYNELDGFDYIAKANLYEYDTVGEVSLLEDTEGFKKITDLFVSENPCSDEEGHTFTITSVETEPFKIVGTCDKCGTVVELTNEDIKKKDEEKYVVEDTYYGTFNNEMITIEKLTFEDKVRYNLIKGE